VTPEALIVTSDLELCQIVRLAVERFGITAAVALSPADALKQLGLSKFDLVIVDCCNLEHGCAALRKMRLTPTHRSAVAVAIVLSRDHARYVSDSGANFVVAHSNCESEIASTLRLAYGLALRERGRYSRFAVSCAVVLSVGDTHREAQMINISQGGACIAGSFKNVTCIVQLRFTLEDEAPPLQATGNIVWQRERRIGVQFTEMPKASRDQLDAWLAREFEAQAKTQPPSIAADLRAALEPVAAPRSAVCADGSRIRPIVTAIIRGGPVGARCSACQGTISLGNTIATPLEQERKLRDAFLAHVQEKHEADLAQILAECQEFSRPEFA
jgi:hypothetical protein